MLVNAVTYTFAPHDADRAEETFRELRDAARAEPGCVRFDVARCTGDTNVFVLYEEYRDEAALDAHYATEHFDRLGRNGIRTFARDRVGYLCRPL